MDNGHAVSLRLAWWNTSLAPLAKFRAKKSEKEFAMTIIKSLLHEYEVDCLALGEVTGDFLHGFSTQTDVTDYSTVDCTTSIGRGA